MAAGKYPDHIALFRTSPSYVTVVSGVGGHDVGVALFGGSIGESGSKGCISPSHTGVTVGDSTGRTMSSTRSPKYSPSIGADYVILRVTHIYDISPWRLTCLDGRDLVVW